MKLLGKNWTRREIEERIGRLEQIGGVRRLKLTEGPGADVELIHIRTGAGLSYYVSPMRGLDISLAEFGGFPISWQSSNGDVHPGFYDARDFEWLRTAVGGLLMSCGLRQAGSPSEDRGEALGLHGRIHHTPARHVSAQGKWIDENYEMIVSGIMEETRIFGEFLRLTREIKSRMGENRIQIKDRVENLGFDPTPLMILYHFNFGFPLMVEETKIKFPSKQVVPREIETPLEGFDKWQAPTADYRERVYYHEQLVTSNDEKAWAIATIQNPHFPLADGRNCELTVQFNWSTKNLPRLIQWKMPGKGVHVLGIEPANCYVEGRAKEKERGTLVTLEPGESLDFELSVELTTK